MEDKELAQKILVLVGTKANISSATHCVTRLRITIKQMDKVKKDEIENLPGVLGVNTVGQQFQVILGNRVTSVYNAFSSELGEVKANSDSSDDKGNLVSRFLDFLSAIFVPIIPAIIGAGLLKGILILLNFYKIVSPTGETYQLLNIFSDSAFYFLPILLAVSSAEKFQVNKFVAAAIAGILVHPNLIALMANGHTPKLFGIPFTSASYSSSVLPIILGVWLMHYVEKLLYKYIPKMLQTVLVPLLTLLIVAPILLAVLGPIGTIVGNAIGQGFVVLYRKTGVVAGALLGAAYPFLVLLGMHVGFTPIMVQSIAKYGVDYVMGVAVSSNSAQAGATTAVYFKTKNKEFKEIAGSSALNAVIGVTEPALFGVTSKLKKPLIAVSLGGAVGGAIAGFFKVTATGMGTGPIAGIPLFFGKTFIFFVIASIVSFVTGFVMTWIIGFDDIPEKKPATETSNIQEQSPHGEIVYSPVNGKATSLTEVKDNVFSTGMVGKGIAVDSNDGKIYAPFDGTVVCLFETKHAIGLKSTSGCEILIHIGLDTVELKGKYFEQFVKQGDLVKKGQLLLQFDKEKIQSAGYDTIISIVITNSGDYASVNPLVSGTVQIKQPLLELEEKLENAKVSGELNNG
ncbi:MAG: beta-glucoside-specific PTS transporter subunit IIABC [Lactobacillus sp.]|nr:beta-glucoside-specific PTS transporter subunit IIABC [Lactobacillus sp.]